VLIKNERDRAFEDGELAKEATLQHIILEVSGNKAEK
jgi:hypothetical protein